MCLHSIYVGVEIPLEVCTTKIFERMKMIFAGILISLKGWSVCQSFRENVRWFSTVGRLRVRTHFYITSHGTQKKKQRIRVAAVPVTMAVN